jgi:hypothetical protein
MRSYEWASTTHTCASIIGKLSMRKYFAIPKCVAKKDIVSTASWFVKDLRLSIPTETTTPPALTVAMQQPLPSTSSYAERNPITFAINNSLPLLAEQSSQQMERMEQFNGSTCLRTAPICERISA